MSVLLGSIFNAVAIVIGGAIGRMFKAIPEQMKETVMLIIGLAIALLGIQMGFESDNFVVIVMSLAIGAVLGEWLKLEERFNRFGYFVERQFNVKGEKGKIAEGFVTASLIFCIGSMAVIGALDSGLRGDHNVLMTKGIIDGFLSIVLASTLGIGVLLSAVPIVIYEGGMALFAQFISAYIPQAAIDLFVREMTATGGVMIMAIGLNVAGITKIRVANLLPALVVVTCIVAMMYRFS